jgi:hypothetical protein
MTLKIDAGVVFVSDEQYIISLKGSDSSPSSAVVENAWSCASTLPMSLHGVVLVWAQGQLYLYLIKGTGDNVLASARTSMTYVM